MVIQTGEIAWTNGPFQPGPWPDIKNFQNNLKKLLCQGERVEADSGYVGDSKVDHPNKNCHNLGQWISKYDVRARHETVNKRMKQFYCLKHVFRHSVEKHIDFFNAVVMVTQINLTHGCEPLYHVPYRTHN